MGGQEEDERKFEPVVFWLFAAVILSIVNYFLLGSGGQTNEWALWLLIIGMLTMVVVDLNVNYYGNVTESRVWMMAGMIVIQSLVTAAHSLFKVTGSTVEDALSGALMTIVIIGFTAFFLVFSEPGYVLMRHLRGFTHHGEIENSFACAVISPQDLAAYGSKAIESRVLSEVHGIMAESYRTEPYWYKYRKLDFLRREFGRTTVFFRLKDQFVEVFFVPKDGIVCRFDRSDTMVKETNFALRKVLNFEVPDQQQLQVMQDEVKELFQDFSRKTVNIPRPKLLKLSFWKQRAGVAFALIILSVLAVILNRSAICNWLSDQRVVLSGLGTIAIIVLTTTLVVIEVYKLRRNK